MRITAIEEYGLRCLLQLARIGTDKHMSITEIAEKEGLSVPYASKLLAIMRRAGLVVAERGRSGGFSIARPPADITMYEVLTTLGGPLVDPDHCRKYSGQLDECIHVDDCNVHHVLGGLAGYIQTFLSATTLADLVNGNRITVGACKESPELVMISDDALVKELKHLDDKPEETVPVEGDEQP
ncbi:MAG: Rrf2 family transcriptional regulator [Candidatus Zixiibacteriota bacterium]|nr:MAG: Rrf2 family transcriptional regulator [candidate division Zixibacteria bacterium]